MADPADQVQVQEGAVEMAIGPDKGRVLVRFKTPQEQIAFDPSNAVAMAKHIIDCAVACGAKVELQVPKRKITERQRNTLVQRSELVMRSMLEKGRRPRQIAYQLVDTILSAVD